MSEIWDNGPEGSANRFVMIALADNANDAGECWPSVGTVARKTGISSRGVQRAIRWLEENGWISVNKNAGKKGTNAYILHPRQGVTPDKVSPTPRQGVTPTPDKVSPEPSYNHQEPSLLKAPALLVAKPNRGTRLLPDWFLPKEWGEWAVGEGWSIQGIKAEADKFRDYWISKAGSGAVKLDWQATWRNWIRAANQKGNVNGKQPSANAAFGATINQLANDLSSGAITLDNSSRDPFATRPRGNA